jgi:hypothetical protein
MEAYVGAVPGSRKAAEKERSYAAARSKKAAKERGAGSEKAEKERALLMLKNLELDEEKAYAGLKIEKEKKVLQNLVPLEFPLPLRPGDVPLEFPLRLRPGDEQEDGGESACSQSKAGGGKRRKKTRLGMEYIDFMAENPLPPLYQPVPSFDLGFLELQERFVAKQLAEREERDNILKQLKEYGYADVEIEVPDYDDDPFCMDGYWHGVKAA